MRETLKDYFLNTGFRKDIFVRGARRMNALQQRDELSKVGVALILDRNAATLKLKLGIGETEAKPELYNPLLDALAQRPHTVAELQALPELKTQSIAGVAQMVAFLMATSQVSVFFPRAGGTDAKQAIALNTEIARGAALADDVQVLASAVLGSALSANLIERLIYILIRSNKDKVDIKQLTSKTWELLSRMGRRMSKEGVTLESVEENLAQLETIVKPIVEVRVPMWRKLGIL